MLLFGVLRSYLCLSRFEQNIISSRRVAVRRVWLHVISWALHTPTQGDEQNCCRYKRCPENFSQGFNLVAWRVAVVGSIVPGSDAQVERGTDCYSECDPVSWNRLAHI